MSWWDTSGLTNFASQATKALKNAQKKIDKVLDIDESGMIYSNIFCGSWELGII